MSLFKDTLKHIEDNHNNKFNCISWNERLTRFSDYMPGTSKAKYYGITGSPGSGKTHFTDELFVYHSIDFAIANSIDLEIVYFTFEISKEVKMLQGISRKIFQRYGLRFSPNALQNIGNYKLNLDQLDKIKQVEDYFRIFERYVTFYDEPLTPNQILKIQMDKIRENGDYDPIKGTYKPNNPNKYLLFIVDHISLIQPEKGQSLHEALSSYSSNNVFVRNKFKASILNVHQQGVDGQIEHFTSKGDNVASKVEPKLAGLGDNRTLGRDYDVILGLFSPKRYEIDFYRGYKTKRFNDHCRWLSIIKNRDGEPDKHVGLYFDGAVGYFEELPKGEEFTITRAGQKIDNDELYNKYEKGLVGILNTDKQKTFTFN